MKKICKLPLIMALVLLFAINTYALEPMENSYVKDYVGVLSPEHVAEMNAEAAALEVQNGVQVVTVITENYEGSDPHSYAVDIYDDLGFGENGILLYVATEDGKIEIIPGEGMEYILSDSKAGNILDTYFVGPAGNNDLDKAIYDTFNALLSVGATATTGQNYNTNGANTTNMISSAIMVFIVIMCMVVVIFIIGNKKGKKPKTQSYGQNTTPDPFNQGNGYVQPNGNNPVNPANFNGAQGDNNQTNPYGGQENYNQANPYGGQENYNQTNPYGGQENYDPANPYGEQENYDPANPYGTQDGNSQQGTYTPGKYGDTSNGTNAPRHNNANFIYYGGVPRRMYYRNRMNGGGTSGGGAGRSFGGGGGGGFRGGGRGRSGGGGAGRSF